MPAADQLRLQDAGAHRPTKRFSRALHFGKTEAQVAGVSRALRQYLRVAQAGAAPRALSPQEDGRASGLVSDAVSARTLSPEWNVGARAGLCSTWNAGPGAAGRSRRPRGRIPPASPRSAPRQLGEASRGEGEAGRGGGRGTRGCGEAGGGERQAAGPGKKGTWLLRRAAASAARGEGAPGASDRDGALEPRAAAAARGREAAAGSPSGGPRPADGRRPPRADGPGDRDGAHPAGGRAGPPGRSLGLPVSSALVVLAAGVEPRQPGLRGRGGGGGRGGGRGRRGNGGGDGRGVAPGQPEVGRRLCRERCGRPGPGAGGLPRRRSPKREAAPAGGPGPAEPQPCLRRGPAASPPPSGRAAAASGLGREAGSRAAR